MTCYTIEMIKIHEVTLKLLGHREASVVTRGYLLAAAYAATFGGTATFVGTGTNLTFRGLFEGKFHKYGSLSFVQWTIMALPQAYLNAFLTWLYVQVAYFGMFRPNSDRAKESRIGPEGEAIAKRVRERFNKKKKL